MAGFLFWVLLRQSFPNEISCISFAFAVLGIYIDTGILFDTRSDFGSASQIWKKEYTGKIGFILQTKWQNFFASKKVYFCKELRRKYIYIKTTW